MKKDEIYVVMKSSDVSNFGVDFSVTAFSTKDAALKWMRMSFEECGFGTAKGETDILFYEDSENGSWWRFEVKQIQIKEGL